MRISPLALWIWIGLLAVALPASSGPMDLGDQRARPVRVAFEVSPPHLPARLDHQYSDRVPGWFEPGPGPGQATIRIAGPDVERALEASNPVPGSFGDFVWTFDVETGHVLSATLSGAFLQELDWGLMETSVEANIAARMTTLRAAGFQAPRSRLGHVVFDHCDRTEEGCSMVPPRAYDVQTGYVNAVGSISVTAMGGLGTETFSPLGEAVFMEMSRGTEVSAR